MGPAVNLKRVEKLRRARHLGVCGLMLGLVALSVTAYAPTTTNATTTVVPRYQYNFAGTTGTVANLAPGGPVLALKLQGSWTNAAHGVHFTGDTAGHHSIAAGQRASGYTLNVPATQALGFGAQVVYNAPSSGSCFSDTPNVAQIGRFASYSAQAKLQLSKCADDKQGVVMECRFAGSKTPSSVLPRISSLALVNRHEYDLTCRKSPDTSAGKATVTLAVTDLSASGGATVTKSFAVSALGALKTTAALSAGNKYPLPAPSQNTDQFVGDINKIVYCTGTSSAVSACLAQHL
jgi:hypothetical protein